MFLNNRNKLIGIILIGISLYFSNCASEGCKKEVDNHIKISFYQYDSLLEKNVKFIVDSLTVYPLGIPDSFYINTSVNEIEFPLSLVSDTTTIVLNMKNNQKDTLFINYKKEPYFVSQHCGFITHFTVDSTSRVTRNAINTFYILTSSILPSNAENIILIFNN